MRVPRREAGTALLVAGAVLLLAALAVGLHVLVASSAPSSGAGQAGLTPSAGGPAGQPAAHAGPGSAVGQPAPGAGGARASAGVVPAVVTVTGPAALPNAHVHPGYDTPEDAVDGFYQALLSGTPTRACAYTTKPCPSFGSRRITGRVVVIEAVSHGAQALVEVTGTICEAAAALPSGSGLPCTPLTDRVPMPTGPASFGTAWTSLTAGVYGWAGSPLPCVQDAATRQWRVKLP